MAAQVPMLDGPSVPQSASPTPRVSVNAPSEAFGLTTLGKGLSTLGQAANEVSTNEFNYAAHIQAIDNKVAADTASVQAAEAIDRMGAEYRANNTQMAAYNNLPDFYKQVEATRAQFGEGLSPLAKVEFDSASRRMAMGVLSATANYAAEQRRVGINASQDAAINMAGQALVVNPSDPAAQENFNRTLGSAAATVFGPTGLAGDDPQVRQYMLTKASPVYASMVKQANDSGDLAKANALLEAHRNDMTPEAYTQVAGTLRAANKANDVANAGATLLHNNGSAELGGSATSGTRAERNNNPLNLTNLPNGEWQGQTGRDGRFAQFASPQAGFAAADANLQSYARHGIDTLSGVINRWAPPSENDTAKYIATVARDTGIAPNAKIDLGDPAVRQRLLVSMARVEGGASGVGSNANQRVQVQNTPPIAPGDDPDVWLAHAETNIAANAKVMFPDNVAEREAAIQSAMTQARREAAPVEATQKAAYMSALGEIQSQNIQDPNEIAQRIPGIWTSVNASQRKSLEAAAKTQGRILTPEQQDTVVKLDGFMAAARAGNADVNSIDITKLGLPPDQATRFLREQAEIANKKTPVAQDHTMVEIMKSPATRQALGALKDPDTGLPLTATSHGRASDGYYEFMGNVRQQLDAWRGANPGKQPNEAQMDQFVANATRMVGAKPGWGWFNWGGSAGTPAFQVPKDWYQAQEAALIRAGKPHNPSDIARLYAQFQAQGGH